MSSVPVSANYVRKLVNKPGMMKQLDAANRDSNEPDIAQTNLAQHAIVQPARPIQQEQGSIYCFGTQITGVTSSFTGVDVLKNETGTKTVAGGAANTVSGRSGRSEISTVFRERTFSTCF